MRAFSHHQITVDSINSREDIGRLTKAATETKAELRLTPQRGTANSPGAYRAAMTNEATFGLVESLGRQVLTHAILEDLTAEDALEQVRRWLETHEVPMGQYLGRDVPKE